MSISFFQVLNHSLGGIHDKRITLIIIVKRDVRLSDLRI